MSEMSLLWHEYKRYNDLSRDVTDDIILLKRVRLHLPGSEEVTSEQRQTSRKRLEAFVAAVEKSLSLEQASISSEDIRLPGALVERIRQANSGLLPRFLTEIKNLHDHLECGEEFLTDRDMEILEGLTNSVNVETSRVFNRLWRK